jgi:formylglycine-generating enzyme required for sulfatase activity
MPLSTGQILNNRYRIVKLLGQGGFGAVYRVWDLQMEGACAIKENLDTSAEAMRQFEKEAKLLFGLRHPGLPRVFDYFVVPAQGQYLVMDYIEGDDLQARLGRQAPQPVDQALGWIGQVCDALSYLHTRTPPVIHRDLKPANIKITPENQAVLVDFGIAKIYDPLLITTRGARAVTQGFSPPEQYGQGRTDAQSDVYALAATTYALLTGQVPSESVEIMSGNQPAPLPAHLLNPQVPPQVSAAIASAMQLNRAQRTASVADFKAALLPPPAVHTPGIQMPNTVLAPAQPPATQPVAILKKKSWQGWAISLALLVIGVLYMLVARTNEVWPFAAPVPSALPTRVHEIDPTIFFATVYAGEGTQISPSLPTSTATLAPTPPFVTALPTITPAPTRPPAPPVDIQPGDAWTRPSDGMTMVYIPAGDFLMGSTDSDLNATDDEKPQHTVTLNAYWIDRTEVTNAMFERFAQATGYQTTAEKLGSSKVYNPARNGWSSTQGANWRHPQGPSSSLDGLEFHPVVQVSWEDASAYCAWAGSRLPIEAEWEKAARGTDGRIYPWGNQPVAGNLGNFADVSLNSTDSDQSINDGYKFTAPVGSYPAGASPYGAYDMAGNVWEWVQDRYDDTYYDSSPSSNPAGPFSGANRINRGGSWNNESRYLRAAERDSFSPVTAYDVYGFRCAGFSPSTTRMLASTAPPLLPTIRIIPTLVVTP